MTAAAREAVTRLVGSGGLPSVSTWADEVRGDPAYAWSSDLHFVNPEHNPPEQCSWNYKRDCMNDFCVVSAVFNYTDQLAGRVESPSDEEALKFLTHFALDMHQPLHGTSSDAAAIALVNYPAQMSTACLLCDGTVSCSVRARHRRQWIFCPLLRYQH